MKSEAEYRALFEAKNELHKILRRVVISTKLGRQHKQPDDDITLDIGNDNLSSCARYEQIRYYPKGFSGEYELDDDLEIINYLIREIKKRFQEFQKARDSNKLKYIKSKKTFAGEFFNPPLTEIIQRYGRIT